MHEFIETLPQEVHSDVLAAYKKRKKSIILGYLAWLFLGWHYLYLRRVGMQFAFWVTFGGFGVWWLIDIFRVGPMVCRINEDIMRGLVGEYSNIYRVDETVNVNVSNYNVSNNDTVYPDVIDTKPQENSLENHAGEVENFSDDGCNDIESKGFSILYLAIPLGVSIIAYGLFSTFSQGTLFRVSESNSEFFKDRAVEPIYTQEIGGPYSTTWSGRLDHSEGAWRDVYVETNEKFISFGILSFDCELNNASPVGWVNQLHDSDPVTQIFPQELDNWMSGTLGKMSGEVPPYELYVTAKAEFC